MSIIHFIIYVTVSADGIINLVTLVSFHLFLEYFNAEGSIPRGLTSGYTPKINAVQKQLKLVAKWKNYDIAKEEIFIAENRNHLTCLQVKSTCSRNCHIIIMYNMCVNQ